MDGGTDTQRICLQLEVDPDAIHGTLEDCDGTRVRFWGWLELMAALERITSGESDAQQYHANGGELD